VLRHGMHVQRLGVYTGSEVCGPDTSTHRFRNGKRRCRGEHHTSDAVNQVWLGQSRFDLVIYRTADTDQTGVLVDGIWKVPDTFEQGLAGVRLIAVLLG